MALGKLPVRKIAPVRIAKITGESPVDKHGRKVIGPKRMAELQRAAKNYSRRIRSRTKKYFGEVTHETISKMSRAEERSAHKTEYITEIDLSLVTNVKRYNTLMRFLKEDTTPAYKKRLTQDRREWMKAMVENGYDIDLNDFPELRDVLAHMSSSEIMRWQTTYNDLVKDIGYHYRRYDMATRDDYWLDHLDYLIASVSEITGKKLPSARVTLGLE